MIEYIEVRASTDRELIGIIDSAKSVLWHSVYYGVGTFEVYAVASERHLQLLQEGNYITRPNCDEIGIIESVSIEYNLQDGLMIAASGRFAKSILDRRHIYNLSGKRNFPTILSGSVESAARACVANNAISCSFDASRNIPILKLGALKGYPEIIVDHNGQAAKKQVSYKNLLEYTDSVLEEYKLAARITLDPDNYNLLYSVYKGTDRSTDNSDGNEAVIFSTEFDNLNESNYSFDTTYKKTAALIGGEGEGLERFYSLVAGQETGLARRETFIDASSISKQYEDEQTYTDAEYKALLDAQGKQELAHLKAEENFDGTLNVSGGVWRIYKDYFIGDVVTIQDNRIGKYINARITEIIEAQDENGYSVEISYINEGAEV